MIQPTDTVAIPTEFIKGLAKQIRNVENSMKPIKDKDTLELRLDVQSLLGYLDPIINWKK